MKYILPLCLLLVLGCKKDNVTPSVLPSDFLSDQKYIKLIIEIRYVTGFEPSATTITNLTTFLGQHLNKSAGISVVQHAMASPGKASYSLQDVVSLESANRTEKTSGNTLTAYFFFADADYSAISGNSKVLGIAYGSSSVVIFEKTIEEFSGDIGQPTATTLETTVMEHEFGHILGLVNNGTAMQTSHQDEPNGHHCNDQDCLMYYNVETSLIADIIGGNVPTLNAQCLADLEANGGL